MGTRGILILGISGFLLGSIWLCRITTASQSRPADPVLLADTAACADFLLAQGIQAPLCVATGTVRLPASLNGAYADYAALQQAQGLPLAEHLQEQATRYTFTQDKDTLWIELLCSDTGVLLGAIQYNPQTGLYQALSQSP